jgi:large subunit ribosomal protein L24
MKKIKKGDVVFIIAGKDKGKKGVVLSLVDKGVKYVVEGLNLVKKHVKANPNKNEKGAIIQKAMPIHCSNVMLYDEVSQKGSKVGIRTLEDGQRVRYFKSNDQLVDVKT